jgi:predicted permease
VRIFQIVTGLLHDLSSDLRYASRQLGTHRAFTLVTLLTLALGAGLNTAVFSLVNAVLLRPLPFREPDAILQLRIRHLTGRLADASLQDYEDWRRETRAFVEMGAYVVRGGSLGGLVEPLKIQHALVTPSLFRTLGIEPAFGRPLVDDENVPGADNVALISDGLWRDAFGRRSDIVGASVDLNGVPTRIVGVMPPSFVFPNPDVRLWKPFGMRAEDGGARDGRWVRVVARARPDVSRRQAGDDFDRVVKELGRRYPATNADFGGVASPLLETMVASSRPALLLLTAAVGVVLAVALANIANLLIARTAGRGRADIAIRLALGATKWRVVRPMLAECLLLSAAGTAAGVAIAAWTAPILASLSGASLPRTEGVAIDGRVLAFTLVMMTVTSLAIAIGPALNSGGIDPAGVLQRASRGIASGGRARRGLVIVEVALAFAALAAGGVVVRSFERADAIHPGFETDGVLTLRLEPPWQVRLERAPDAEAFMRQHAFERESMVAFYDALLQRVRAVSGVTAAAAINRRPFSGRWWSTELSTDASAGSVARPPRGLVRVVTPGYFETMRIPLKAGRTLRSSDDVRAAPVVVVSDALARAAWLGASAVGRRVWLNPEHPYEVVGVVGDVKQDRPDGDDEPVAYFSFAQAPWGHFGDWGMDIVVRAARNPLGAARSVRDIIRSAAPALPLAGPTPMDDLAALSLADRRFRALLFGTFGALTAILSTIGLGGLLVMMVNERSREMGVRSALGASPFDLVCLVLGEAARVVGSGLAIGALLAISVAPAIRGLLFGVAALDPPTYLAAAALVASVSMVACVLPLVRAARQDPALVLRSNA